MICQSDHIWINLKRGIMLRVCNVPFVDLFLCFLCDEQKRNEIPSEACF